MFGRGKKKDKAAAKPKKEKKAKAKKAKPAKKPKVKKPKGAVKKRPTDVYTVMILLSTGFVALSVLFLFLALGAYGFPGETTTPWK